MSSDNTLNVQDMLVISRALDSYKNHLIHSKTTEESNYNKSMDREHARAEAVYEKIGNMTVL